RPRAAVRGDPRLPEAFPALRRDRRERLRLAHTLVGHASGRSQRPGEEAPPMADLMEAVTSLAKRRGIAFQSSEIYGGLRSSWDYGPLGVQRKKNVKAPWCRSTGQRPA